MEGHELTHPQYDAYNVSTLAHAARSICPRFSKSCPEGPAEGAGRRARSDDYYDLRSYRRPVTTRSEAAQRWFDRGLAWTYGYNHEEAVACFRRALDAVLLEQDRVEEATAVYRADLGYDDTLSRACQRPDNVWSLHGYHECLERLGRDAEATIVKQRLDLAMARTDVPITASCFCRLSTR